MSPTERPAPPHERQMAIWKQLGGRSSGIVGDKRHKAGGHRGAAYVPASDYTRHRDPNGADGPYTDWGYAVSGDYWHGGDKVLRARHAVLLTRLMDDDPALANVWEFIGQPWPSRPVYYWQVAQGRRVLKKYTGAGHDTWSHITIWRSRANWEPQLWLPENAKPAVRRTPPAAPRPPAWPQGVRYFRAARSPKYSATVRAWQARMRQRGWPVKADGYFGPTSERVLRSFQREKHLGVDGLLGPKSFAAAWTVKVTK